MASSLFSYHCLPLLISVSKFPLSYWDGTHPNDPLPWLSLWRPCLQIRWHPEVLGVRTSTQEDQPIAPASSWAATQTRLRNLAMLTGILYRSPKDLCKSTEFCPLFAVPTECSALVVPVLQWTVLALSSSHQSLGHKVLGKWKQIWESTFHRWLQPSPFFPSPWPVKHQTHSKFFAFEI